MNAATRAASRRWAAALAGVVAVASLPAVAAAWPVRAGTAAPSTLLARALRADALPYSGLVESRGSLEVPDLPRSGDTGRLLGSTNRLRVWWADAARWRVDLLAPATETDTYHRDAMTVTWDSSRNRVRTSYAAAARVRVPRTTDLLPPQLARRLLSVAAPDELRPLGARRVAGRPAAGLRVVPRNPDTTIGRVDVWVDSATGLPLDVRVVARGHRSAQVRAQFLDVRLGRPGARVLDFSPPAGARLSFNRSVDLATAVDEQEPAALPGQLAGLSRSRGPVALSGSGAVVTFGDGYSVLAVLPLPWWVASRTVSTLRAARRLSLPGVDAVLVPMDLAPAVVVATADRGYLLTGTVREAVVTRAATELVT